MGTSIENGGGGSGEEVEEEVIPWSCVDETIRKELIIRLNPEHVMSGNNWRGLAGRLDYTTGQIMAIESEKGNNTREFFNSYDFKTDSSFNEVYQALKEMERLDCVGILDKYLPRIRRNVQLEKDKEARILEESMTTPPQPSCHYHYSHSQQTPQHSMGIGSGGGSCVGCSCGVPPPHLTRSLSAHHHSVCSMAPPLPPLTLSAHNSHHRSGSAGYPSSPCCHMGAMTHHPLQMPPPPQPPSGSCMAAAAGGTCGNHSPTKACSHTCSQQHLQMDISQSIPKCSGGYFYPPGHPIPSVVNHHSNNNNMAFSDHQPHNNNNNNMISATSPAPCQYYNVRDPSYSPKVSPDTNSKPYNFSVSGACPPGMMNSLHQGNGGRGSMDQRSGGGSHKMEHQNHQNILVNNKGGDSEHLLSNTSAQFHSNENNMSYPTSPSASSSMHPPPPIPSCQRLPLPPPCRRPIRPPPPLVCPSTRIKSTK